jgi:hypothetical protein
MFKSNYFDFQNVLGVECMVGIMNEWKFLWDEFEVLTVRYVVR